jgi:hypothetical protein
MILFQLRVRNSSKSRKIQKIGLKFPTVGFDQNIFFIYSDFLSELLPM